MPNGFGYGYGPGMGYGRGYGRGGGRGGGSGFGFRGASPPWPHVGRGRGGLPRCYDPRLYGTYGDYPHYGPPDYGSLEYGYPPAPSREQEVGMLKERADSIRREMEDIEKRVQELQKQEE